MPRGRKKKNITVDTVELFSSEELTKKGFYCCDVCNGYSRVSPVRINLTHFLGKATYYRKCKLDSISVCDKCSSELSEVVDKWILSKNSSLEKFK